MLRKSFFIWTSIVIILTFVIGPAFAQVLPLDPRTLTKYMEPLPIPGAMPQADSNYYEIGMYPIVQQLHPQLPPTSLWGYGTSKATASYPAATIVATRGVSIQVKWTNNLVDSLGNPLQHPLAVDQTLCFADPFNVGEVMTRYTGPVPTSVHVHGCEVQSTSDGGPETWFTPGFALTGKAWPGQIYTYPNSQQAATIWYHDHGLGVDRVNVMMGLAGYYIITDPANEPANLPSGTYEVPICIQDRMFNIDGSISYPSLGNNPTIHPFWVPEFFGNTIVVNGKIWPFLNVEPRKYRFRFLNGSNARFYGLKLINPVTGLPGPAFFQIGTDGGYLARPVMLNNPLLGNSPRLVIAPGERADIIIDFTGVPVGTTFILDNNAKAPYPAGAPPDPRTLAQIMQFRVVPLTGTDNSVIPAVLNTIPTLTPSVATRSLTLNEVAAAGGPTGMYLNGRGYCDTLVTETPTVGTTEVWEIINLTADTHPIHLHLVQFQLLNRQKFQLNKYMKVYSALNPIIPVPANATYTPLPVGPYLQGAPIPPDSNEMGWKDTFRANPGEVTRVIIRFASQNGTPFPFDATVGPGYVWHCHILEHEENDMMRPLKMLAPPLAKAMTQAVPTKFALDQNYPNPFNPETNISFYLSEKSEVNLAIYNILGQKVRTLAEGPMESGSHTVTWNGKNESGSSVASGIYFYKLNAGDNTVTKKMTLLK